jgi:hypothetical protein
MIDGRRFADMPFPETRFDAALSGHGYLPPFGALGNSPRPVAALIRALFVTGNCFANKVTQKIQNCLFSDHIYGRVTFRYVGLPKFSASKPGRLDLS